MDALANLYLPGAVTVWCALFFGLATFWGYSQVLRGDRDALVYARRGYSFFALSVVLSAVVMALCLWRRDFRIEYVYQYSGLDLQNHFQLAAFWAGQKGSFMIWLLWGALLGMPLARSAGRDEPTVMIVYLLTLFGLLFILVRENPFVMLPETPADGAGLNPLLQDDWMVIHPPIMFIGYASTAIPFAFALAALWRRDTSNWATRAFPWTLGGFLVLGSAILMGGYWAYKTLGWGGYWGWDPVENASLIPWLVGTVLIHGLYLERSRKRYRRLNLVLACLMYLSVLYGTFLTRSGVLADFSVHSFVDLGISGWLVALMAGFGLASVYFLATGLPHVPTEPNQDPLLSRGTFVMMSTIAVAVSTFVITIGTSSPMLTGWFMDNPAQVGPEFYNTVNSPIALLIVILLAVVPFLTWKQASGRDLLHRLVPSGIAAVIITAASLYLGVREPFHLLFLALAAAALTSNVGKVVAMSRDGGFARSGGYIAHIGVGVMFIGILASSAYDQSAKITLPQGETQKLGDLSLTFKRIVPRQGFEKERMEVEVVRDDGFRYVAYPKLFLNDRTQQLMINPDVRKTMLQDFYISPIQYEPASPPIDNQRVQLAKGERIRVGDVEIRFVDFDFENGADPQTQLASGGPVTIGARLEAYRAGETQDIEAVYRFSQDGRVETPLSKLPQQGWIAMTGILPNAGRIQLDLTGLGSPSHPAKLSIDVTRKPLIALVWYGLWVILIGGFMSTWKRLRAARKVDEIEDKLRAVA